MEWLQQWIANRQKRQELNNQKLAANPVAAADAANIWRSSSNSNTVPVTEGPGTTLVQQEDGTVIRVPTGEETPGSTIIQIDDQPSINEVDYDKIPKTKSVSEKVDDLLSMEEAKAQWLHKTRNSPAQRSGAWDSDEGREELWQTHLRNQQWRKDKGRSYTHGHLLPSANEKTTTEKVDDFIQNGTTEEIPVEDQLPTTDQVPTEEQLPTTDQVPTEEQTTSGKVDDLLEKEANKRKNPQNPIELQLNRV